MRCALLDLLWRWHAWRLDLLYAAGRRLDHKTRRQVRRVSQMQARWHSASGQGRRA